MLAIPDSNLIVIVAADKGAFIYCLEKLDIIAWFDET
jgi:hypothetical protein